ncbi:hypothetical protein K438DRAFT_1784583 [Mycena galopus ATCC 62051]|nr:hypothetical protein K438DRAFT_1784583 [Mycena galopus ATCC 62051]
MPSLEVPQELLTSIVSEVDDIDSLKACSLARSGLRRASQRLLFWSFHVGGDPERPPSSYGPACVLLENSPHIAAYIIRLHLILPHIGIIEPERLPQILSKLVNVHHCSFTGGGYHWVDLAPGTAPVLFEFLSHQPLQELHVENLYEIPPTPLLGLLTAAPRLALSYMSVERKHVDLLVLLPSPHASGLQRLAIPWCSSPWASDEITQFLTQPGFMSYTQSLRFLCTAVAHSNANLIAGCANTLEHIRFTSPAGSRPALFLPRSPALRSVEINTAASLENDLVWFADTICPLLTGNSSPALTDIIMTLYNLRVIDDELAELWDYFNPSAARLDAALAQHPAAPRIRWRIDPSEPYAAALVVAFTELARNGLRRAHENGRLVIEVYEYRDPELHPV